MLFWCIWEAAAAVWCYLIGQYAFAVVGCVGACLYWQAYHRARRGMRPAFELRWAGLLIGLTIAAFFVP